MSTTFCGVDVPLWDGMALFVDGNSKITWDNGTYVEPKPNAFSLPHISSCPGSTPACRSTCYVHGLQKNAPDIYSRYALNAATLHRLFMSSGAMQRSAATFGKWIAENCKGGFRWHVSGDIMHARHATWISSVCAYAPDVAFWLYTRTLSQTVLGCLSAPNLAVNISADRDNLESALVAAKRWDARICYMAQDADPRALPELPEGSVIFPDYAQRGRDYPKEGRNPTEHPWWQGLTQEQKRMVCPPDFFGQSEQHRCGPCTKCLVSA